MMKSPFKFLLIVPSLFVTACGYGLKEIYNGIPYSSGDFFKNYYSVWDDRINPYNEGKNKITQVKEEYELTNADSVFSSFNDAAFEMNETNADKYVYYYDLSAPEKTDTAAYGKKPYGPAVKLSNYDDSFRYGVVGKLFDGQLFCNGYYAAARVQVKPGRGNGFGALFSKECNNATYMMLNFKCALITENSQNLGHGTSDLKLIISLIFKENNGYIYQPVTYTLPGVPTNSGDAFNSTGRYDAYRCFGFNMKGILDQVDSDRLIGFSFEYEKLADSFDSVTDEKYHAVMLYEVSFPHTSWH